MATIEIHPTLGLCGLYPRTAPTPSSNSSSQVLDWVLFLLSPTVIRGETHTWGLSQSVCRIPYATVVGGHLLSLFWCWSWKGGKAGAVLWGTWYWSHAELKNRQQPSTGTGLAWIQRGSKLGPVPGLLVTRDNKFPFQPVLVRFPATCNQKNPTYSYSLSLWRT